MQFLNEYAVSIVVASLVAILLDTLLPAGNSKKYMGILIGLFVMLIILNPLTKLPHYKQMFLITEKPHLADSIPEPFPYVAEMFEDKLAQTMQNDIKDSLDINITCRVFCYTNKQGQIVSIRRVTLSPYLDKAAAYLSQKYDIEEALITP